MLKNNESFSYYSYWCYGGARWPPSDGSGEKWEARSVAHRVWSLGCWSYIHAQQGHSSILTRLQKYDPIFNMRVDIMKPVFNLEPIFIGSICYPERNGPEAPRLLLWLKCFSGLQMGPGLRMGLRGSVGNL